MSTSAQRLPFAPDERATRLRGGSRTAGLVVVLVITFGAVATGCRSSASKLSIRDETDAAQAWTNVVSLSTATDLDAATETEEVPFTIHDEATEYWDLSPEEAVHLTLANSTVLRQLGGSVVAAPDTATTIYDAVLQETDPRVGIDAALSRFDAQLRASAFFDNNDRAVNNRFLGGGANIIQQDLGNYQLELSKRGASGTNYAIRKLIDYDANNLPGNLFPSAWTAMWETEVRHPLMRGGGTGFNRIAGPGSVAGNPQGVVIARLNTDISVIEFQQQLRELVNDVENAYWDLYFAYRLLDTRKSARDRTLQILKRIRARSADLPGGAREQEALAEAQYFALEIEVQNQLGGRLSEGTEANNGSRGGTFRGNLGIHVAERRLRLLMGVPLNDGRLIRPVVDPLPVRVIFDWDEIVEESFRRRTELRKQQLEIRRREWELVAAKNFLLPQLDVVARHRFRGFGKNLLNSTNQPGYPIAGLASPRFDNAIQDLLTGDFQEWQLGMELLLPIGYREGYNAVRNAQLRVARERAVLDAAKREIRHDLANAISDLHRAHEVARLAQHRRQAVTSRRELLEERDSRTGGVDPAVLIDIYRQEADADAEYVRALVEHSLAIKNIHFEKGSLLEYAAVYLSDGG
ncbi:MAG: TolC family protein [Planctomycetaceae bacterium]|nr:MAG: TolC family protein [Planctomycetaceae bacterium]